MIVRKLEMIPPSELRPHPNHSRIHPSKQKEKFKRTYTSLEVMAPVMVNDESMILAGHLRVTAALELGLSEIPVVRLTGLTVAQQRAYMLADNRIPQDGSYNEKKLREEFGYLDSLLEDFQKSITGFDDDEIDALLQPLADGESIDPADRLPKSAKGPPVTKPGYCWQIGQATRLFCGDAREAASYETVLQGRKSDLIFADMPWNVPVQGHVSGLGQVQHREFAMASGEMTREQFRVFIATICHQLIAASKDGSIHFHCCDWRMVADLIDVGRTSYTELKNLIVWAKTNAGMGSLYRSQHELIAAFKSGSAEHTNNVKLGKNGRYRTNLWTYPGANGFSRSRDQDLANHPTAKPVAMVADAILDCSKRGDSVLDPCAGSGTTLVAAHKTKRLGFGIEIDPVYCDVIVRRMTEQFGLEAYLDDGRTFAELAAQASDGEAAQ